MTRHLILTLACCLIFACSAGAQEPGTADSREPIVGGPCEGCANVFVGLPAELGASARIAPIEEPGQPLTVRGTVRDADGQPAAGVIVYAYHTDDRGDYPAAETRHGRLRAWAQTDPSGGYRFDTIRPAGYPGTSIPQHIHMHVIEPGRCTYFIDDINFTDDERLTPAGRRLNRGRGGPGLLTPEKDDSGTWLITRDIVLGENIPHYDRCSSSS